jgi:hypothetical protein
MNLETVYEKNFEEAKEFVETIDWDGCVENVNEHDRIHYVIRMPPMKRFHMKEIAELCIKICSEKLHLEETAFSFRLQCPKTKPVLWITVKLDETGEIDLQEYIIPLSFYERKIMGQLLSLMEIPKLEKIE